MLAHFLSSIFDPKLILSSRTFDDSLLTQLLNLRTVRYSTVVQVRHCRTQVHRCHSLQRNHSTIVRHIARQHESLFPIAQRNRPIAFCIHHSMSDRQTHSYRVWSHYGSVLVGNFWSTIQSAHCYSASGNRKDVYSMMLPELRMQLQARQRTSVWKRVLDASTAVESIKINYAIPT